MGTARYRWGQQVSGALLWLEENQCPTAGDSLRQGMAGGEVWGAKVITLLFFVCKLISPWPLKGPVRQAGTFSSASHGWIFSCGSPKTSTPLLPPPHYSSEKALFILI